jgi:hypothetical protein
MYNCNEITGRATAGVWRKWTTSWARRLGACTSMVRPGGPPSPEQPKATMNTSKECREISAVSQHEAAVWSPWTLTDTAFVLRALLRSHPAILHRRDRKCVVSPQRQPPTCGQGLDAARGPSEPPGRPPPCGPPALVVPRTPHLKCPAGRPSLPKMEALGTQTTCPCPPVQRQKRPTTRPTHPGQVHRPWRHRPTRGIRMPHRSPACLISEHEEHKGMAKPTCHCEGEQQASGREVANGPPQPSTARSSAGVLPRTSRTPRAMQSSQRCKIGKTTSLSSRLPFRPRCSVRARRWMKNHQFLRLLAAHPGAMPCQAFATHSHPSRQRYRLPGNPRDWPWLRRP